MENIIISNKKELEEKISQIVKDGKDKFHVVADFDGTLTNTFFEGKKVKAIISVLRDGDYLTPEYRKKAHEFAAHYGAIESDPSVPFEEKKKFMEEWWEKHFDLLIKTGLSKKDLERVVKERRVHLREGTKKLFKKLNEYEIPLVIISSSGIGNAIPMYLHENNILFPNIYFVTNSFIWDKDGKAIEAKRPIIHSLNKDETSIKEFDFYHKVKNRKNVLLLGDSAEDLRMVKGFPYKKLVGIGFLNEEPEKNLESFKRNFDVVVLNDSDMSYVNGLINRILK